MKEYGTIFSAPMVRAILEGRKTMTRRPVKIRVPEAEGTVTLHPHKEVDRNYIEQHRVYPRWHVGDRLWGRETFRNTWCSGSPTKGYDACVEYKATWDGHRDPDNLIFHGEEMLYGGRLKDNGQVAWKPSIHMPRWASRALLEVMATKIEWLQDISEEDAIAEGVELLFPSTNGIAGIEGTAPESHGYKNYLWHGTGHKLSDSWPYQFSGYKSARDSFSSLWQSIYGKKPGLAWADNPWILKTIFTRT